jgi:hypothetical protein
MLKKRRHSRRVPARTGIPPWSEVPTALAENKALVANRRLFDSDDKECVHYCTQKKAPGSSREGFLPRARLRGVGGTWGRVVALANARGDSWFRSKGVAVKD